MLELLKTAARLSQKNITYLIWGVGTLVAATAGPFGTYASISFSERVVYWGLVIISSSLMGAMVRDLSNRLAGDIGAVVEDGATVGMMSVAYTPFVWLLTLELVPHKDGTEPSFWTMAGFVAVITAGVTVARRLLHGEPSISRRAPSQPMPRLMRRLPTNFDGNIIRLNVNDHQVTVVTTDGDYSIRLRFGDAIEEMDPVDGFCTHRSHWVVKQAVSGWEKEKGKTYLRLVNGDRVPVSRTYRPELEEAGLL